MWVGLLIDRSNSNLENINLINEHALNREPVLLSPTSLISPPPFQGKKVNKAPSLLSPLPPPLIILHFTVLINHDCKTYVDWSRTFYSPTGISYWSVAAWPPTSHTCGFPLCILVLSGELKPWSLLNKIRPGTPISNMSPGLFSPAPPPPTQMWLK